MKSRAERNADTRARSLEIGLPKRAFRSTQPPPGFSAMNLDPQQREFIERQAVEIFVQMANRGEEFNSCLKAVFLSGMACATAVQAHNGWRFSRAPGAAFQPTPTYRARRPASAGYTA